MEKKSYITPSCLVQEVEVNCLETVSLNPGTSPIEGEDAGSKNSGMWDSMNDED